MHHLIRYQTDGRDHYFITDSETAYEETKKWLEKRRRVIIKEDTYTSCDLGEVAVVKGRDNNETQ